MNKKALTATLLWVSLCVFSVVLVGSYISGFSASAGWQERAALLNYSSILSSKWMTPYINAVGDYIYWLRNNSSAVAFSKYVPDIVLNSNNSAYSNASTKWVYTVAWGIDALLWSNGQSIRLTKWNVPFSKYVVGVWTDYYSAYRSPPKNPTVVLPIPNRGDTVTLTDPTPFFVSFFQNWDASIGWGFTRVDLIDNSTWDWSTWNPITSFYLWQAAKWDTYQVPAGTRSYTYWFVQSQSYTGVFLPGGNMDMTKVAINSYPTLSNGTYWVLLQNINRFWLKSDRIVAGRITINSKIIADFYPVVAWDPVKAWKNVVGNIVNLSYKDNVKVVIKNPSWYSYDVINPDGLSVDKSCTTTDPTYSIWYSVFCPGSLKEWTNVFVMYARDIAGNQITTQTLIINVDTVAPTVMFAWVDVLNYEKTATTDGWYNVMVVNWQPNVNDNIPSPVLNNIPAYATIIDNSDISTITIMSAPAQAWPFTPVLNQNIVWSNTYFQASATDLSSDWDSVRWIEAVDAFWNISTPKAMSFRVNRIAESPIILTNGWLDMTTGDDNVNISLEVPWDTAKIAVNGVEVPWYTPFTKNFQFNRLIALGKNDLSLSVYDIMWNISPSTMFHVYRSGGSNSLKWNDQTIRFQWWVSTNQIDLQRSTANWAPGELFSK